MALFTIENHILKIDPDTLAIPEFRVLWERDKSKTKDKAYKELSFVYYYCDFKSPYQSYPEAEREEKVIQDFVRLDDWKPDKVVKNSVEKYNEFQNTPTMRLLTSARVAIDKLAEYFREAEPEDKNYTANLKQLGLTIESLDKLEERVKKEITSQNKIRGGGEARNRER